MAKCEPKFSVGELVQHKLGFKCLISGVFTSVRAKETDEVTELEVPIYAIHYLADNGGVIESQTREEALEPYVAS